MKKVKFFTSFYKERDWLEEMATQGWLLTDITLGLIYHFKETQPCEKVYEIERFAISQNPTVMELTARTNAISLAKEFGWEVAAHDEDMNYYFVKDKAGDETDEFYDDENDRKNRAERYRNRFCIELPQSLVKADLLSVPLYVILFCLFIILLIYTKIHTPLLAVIISIITAGYFLNTLSTSFYILKYIKWGTQIYKELCMTREEWESFKKYSEKKSFHKVQQLRSYLQEKSEFGLSLSKYEGGIFSFEKDENRYNYYIDTKKNLVKRMKKHGKTFTDDSKNWLNISPKWYEVSIVEAAKYNLKPIGIIKRTAIVYKRPYSDNHKDNPLPWENGNETIGALKPSHKAIIAMIVLFFIGFLLGSSIFELTNLIL